MSQLLRFIVILATCVFAAGAVAQPYPSKPIEMVIHSNPGAGQDVFGRLLAEINLKEKLLPQPFAVVNRAGGSGAVAGSFLKTKHGDPYYLYSTSTTIVLSLANRPELGLGLDIYTPIALFGFDLQSVTVPADSKYKTFKDLVDAANREPNSIVAGISSATGSGRLMLYHIEKATGARFKYVSFKSGSDAMAAVMGNHVALTTENVSEVLAAVQAKKLRLLAVPADQRLAGLPDVPTLKELGYNIRVGGGRGFSMPGGAPKEAVAVMEAALARAHKSPLWRDYATKNMYEDTYVGSAAFSQYLKENLAIIAEFMEYVGGKK
ncbi:MAG TPA: tripartite tricarboxylate transporter substrate binding protein [Burkholderiales bacterium]|nr:tripartite tricarboxylate transporter substrate binding protein [Burkholderiales bacterium]